MADEANPNTTEDQGTTLEGAAEALGKARQAAAEGQDDGNKIEFQEKSIQRMKWTKIEGDTEGAQNVATQDLPQDSPPDQQDAADADQQTDADAAQTTIEAPSWFNAEERELFAALPPEQQQAVQRLANSTKAAESRRQNEHQAKLAEYEQEAQAAAQERQYFQSQLQHYKHPVEAAFRQQFADVLSGQMDLFRLSQDPQRWPAYQAFQAEFARIGQQETMLAQRAEQEEQVRLQKHIETRNAKLFEAMPDLKDQAKFEKFDADITAYLRNYNVPDDRIARISYEELDIVHKAMKWDAAQKARANPPKMPQAGPGQKVIQAHVRTLPRVIKPGTTGDAGASDEKLAALDQRARQSGSTEDAAARLRARREMLMRRA